MNYVEKHQAWATRSKKIAAEHAETCPISAWARRHVAAVEKMAEIAATGVESSGTAQMHLGEDLYLLPDGNGDENLDRAILACQDSYPSPNVDGFGRAIWASCNCGHKHA